MIYHAKTKKLRKPKINCRYSKTFAHLRFTLKTSYLPVFLGYKQVKQLNLEYSLKQKQ